MVGPVSVNTGATEMISTALKFSQQEEFKSTLSPTFLC